MIELKTLVTGFEPARPSFEGPTSQGHHTFPYFLNTLTPVSEHLPPIQDQATLYKLLIQGVPRTSQKLRETILRIRGIPKTKVLSFMYSFSLAATGE